MDYHEFLRTKDLVVLPQGIEVDESDVHPSLFDFQRAIVRLACWKGRFAIFADTGLGKTVMQIEWARLMDQVTLIIAPLAVAQQTVREGQRIGVHIEYVRSMDEVRANGTKVFITNYEMIEHFEADYFGAVVLDESSILKNLTGKTKQRLVNMFSETPYRLCCTATPAPNDITELANHSEFLGVMSRAEMMATFFVYNALGTSKADSWRVKGHAVDAFYRWMASWALPCKKPSDLGYADDGYDLPPLNKYIVEVDSEYAVSGMLPGFEDFVKLSAIESKRARRETIQSRLEEAKALVKFSDEQFIIWTALNDEADALHEVLPGSVNVQGSMSPEEKADAIMSFIDGEVRVLITKTSIAGFGLNLQQCRNMVFFGIDYSWESYYQAIRRVWRFGQENEVNVWVITSKQESHIYDVVLTKEVEAENMTRELIKASAKYSMDELGHHYHQEWKYGEGEECGRGWRMLLGDSVTRMSEIDDNSVDVSVYSPPFADLFVYSATPQDVGNNGSTEDFLRHYGFIIRETLRVTKPGRMCAVHIADGRAFKSVDGYVGRKDLSGDIIEAHIKEGWIFRQRITIDKNPQAQAIRLKDHGLMFKTLDTDATDLAGGHADYLLIFRKPGDNQVPVLPVVNGDMTRDDWILWAHPVWYDIRETHTLNERVARTDEDEKHMCPLQLDVIERVCKLWSNPGELVFSPFAGIGSEGYEALRWGREFLGIELKPEYFKVACQNLRNAETTNGKTLFDWAAEQEASNG